MIITIANAAAGVGQILIDPSCISPQPLRMYFFEKHTLPGGGGSR